MSSNTYFEMNDQVVFVVIQIEPIFLLLYRFCYSIYVLYTAKILSVEWNLRGNFFEVTGNAKWVAILDDFVNVDDFVLKSNDRVFTFGKSTAIIA
jgi:hypothetical protein